MSEAALRKTVDLVRQHGSVRAAAVATGKPKTTLTTHIAAAAKLWPSVVSVHPGRPTIIGPWPDEAVTERVAAVKGLTGGPPIPDIGIPPEGFVVRRNSAQYDGEGNLERQWVESGQGSAEGYSVPDGHVVKGESALLDANGNVLAKWIKTREGSGPGLVDALRAAFADYDGAAPARLHDPRCCNHDLLTVYPLPDVHFGLYAWKDETGDDYDIDIAAKIAEDSIGTLVAQSLPSSEAVILVLGDFYHQNDGKNVTPTNHHQLDVDGRWPKVYMAGAKLLLKIVALARQKHAHVELKILKGNHDEDAAVTLAVAMSLFFSNDPCVTVNINAAIAWYKRFGSCLLGASHGHTMKPEAMAMAMACDRAEDWGQTRFRAYYSGHIHHETAKEIMGVRVESFQSPAAKDSYNAGHGYRAGRALTAITHHKNKGEIGRHRVEISGS